MIEKIDGKIYNFENKKGISLLALVVTIIIALILITTATFSFVDNIDNSKISRFADDLIKVQNEVKTYYIINGIIPSLNESTIMNKDDLLAISNSQSVLLEEITENGDLNSSFYTIDLSKINITSSSYGAKQLGDNDIFVISYPTMKVYYPYGLKTNDAIYFSVTSKISNLIDLSQSEISSQELSTISSGGIKVTKINGWTNKMGINIDVEINNNESLYMSVSGEPNRLITTTIGQNIFDFDLLSSIVNDSETIKIPSLTIEEANYIEQPTKPIEERYIDILKYSSDELVGQVRIDLSNFSNTIPTVESAIITTSLDSNIITLSLDNSDSGIKEIRYEYLTKYAADLTIENYYDNVIDFDETYMRTKGKVVSLSNDLEAIITIPEIIESIKIIIIDNAENVNLFTLLID